MQTGGETRRFGHALLYPLGYEGATVIPGGFDYTPPQISGPFGEWWHSMNKSLAAFLAATAILALSTGCTPKTANRGNIPPPSQIEKLEVGKHSMEYVRSVLGTPSTVGTFDQNVWYYIGRRTERWAFFDESVMEQQVVAIYFDNGGKIEHIQTYDANDARKVEMVERKTPTAGHELGVMEQIIGNLGRFNKPAAASNSRY